MATDQGTQIQTQDDDFVPLVTGRARSIALVVVLLAMFMDLLDNTIINVALPSMSPSRDPVISATAKAKV
ncbi:hypothetical protein [Streptomyces sp. GbtcB6]|uniref:hypothetical protein n=1 Tax=Streptomyces sp. GbtcB6 TaxID=2824751 RepID=UPI001C2F243D|nr:hypothetical protein [Streptomyces sp. GbtcB6]